MTLHGPGAGRRVRQGRRGASLRNARQRERKCLGEPMRAVSLLGMRVCGLVAAKES